MNENDCSVGYFVNISGQIYFIPLNFLIGLREEGKSATADHVFHNKDFAINFNKPKVLAQDNEKKGREITETQLIFKTLKLLISTLVET